MADRRENIIADLEKGLADSIALFESFKPEELKVQVYEEEPFWTVKQVLAHFITIEKSMQWLFKNILEGGSGSPEDFDIDRFNRTQPPKLDPLDVDALLVKYRAVRNETISIVREMSENDLDREGRHPFHGQGKLERFITWAYEHVRLHEKDIQKALKMAD